MPTLAARERAIGSGRLEVSIYLRYYDTMKIRLFDEQFLLEPETSDEVAVLMRHVDRHVIVSKSGSSQATHSHLLVPSPRTDPSE